MDTEILGSGVDPAGTPTRRWALPGGTAFWLVLALNALAIAPLLWSGYINDDSLNSQVAGYLTRNSKTLWALSSESHHQWLHEQGRFAPLLFLTFPLFYYIRSLFLYKLLIFVLTLGSICAFQACVRRLSGSVALALTAAAMFPLALQFHATVDPVLAFAGFYQELAIALFGSIALFCRYLDEKRTPLLVASAGLFLISALIYENVYPLTALFVLAAYSRTKDWVPALKKSVPLLVLSGVLFTVWLGFRSQATALSTGAAYSSNLSPGVYLKTLIGQTVGTLPFAAAFFSPVRDYMRKVPLDPALWLVALCVAALSAWLLYSALRALHRGLPAVRIPSLLAALTLIVAPSVFISAASKYQAYAFGDTYLQSFLCAFGIALLLALAIAALPPRYSRALLPISLTLGVLSGYMFSDRAAVVTGYNSYFLHPRAPVERALAGPFAKTLTTAALVLYDPSYAWLNADTFAAYGGMPVRSLPVNAEGLLPALTNAGAVCVAAGAQGCSFTSKPVYYFSAEAGSAPSASGAALLRVQKIYFAQGKIAAIESNGGEVYCEFSHFLMNPLSPTLHARRIQGDGDLSVEGGGFQPGEALEPGRQHLRFNVPLFEATSLRLSAIQKTAVNFAPVPAAVEPIPPAPPSTRILAPGDLLHIRPTSLGNGKALGDLALTTPLSIDIVLRPAADQVPSATVISNHGMEQAGFTIEQSGIGADQYAFGIGDGSAYITVARFVLTPNERHYLSLQFRRDSAALYLDGKAVGEKQANYKLQAKPALRLGNWVGDGRGFHGTIEECAIRRGNRTPEEIRTQAAKVGVGR